MIFILFLFAVNVHATEPTQCADNTTPLSTEQQHSFSAMMKRFLHLEEHHAKKSEPSEEIPAKRDFPIDPNANPCDSLYAYACNPVIQSFKLKETRSRHIFSLHDSSERILEARKSFLKNLKNLKDPLSPEQKKSPEKYPEQARIQSLKDNYLACMDEEASKQEEREKITQLQKTLDGLKDRKSFLEFLGKNIITSKYKFVEFSTHANQKNPDWNDVIFGANLMNLPEQSYYKKPDVMKDYEVLLVDFFKTLYLPNAETRAKKIIEFETAYAKVYPTPTVFRNRVNENNYLPRNEWLKRYPNLALDETLKKIPEKTQLRSLEPEALKFLNDTLAHADLSFLKDFYLYNAVIMDDAYPEFFQKGFKFRNKHLGGPPVRPPRDERCARFIGGNFEKEFDAALLPELFPHFDKQKFNQLVEAVKNTMISRLEKNTWLSANARENAVKKMRATRLQLASPNNDEEWDFNPIAVYDSKHPIQNNETLNQLNIDKELAELSKPRNKNRWGMGPLTINAYYSPTDNKFVMLQGILQYPIYDPDAPDYVNLGSVGVVVGHENGHGIDDKGWEYNDLGALKPWTTAADKQKFKEKTSKLIEQYNRIGHNGELTLGENIGDLTGISFAYDTAFPEGKGTPEQKRAFFTQYARTWCGVIRPKEYERLIAIDPHSQSSIRVNEVVKHFKGFYEAFDCKAGDPMYLDPKYRVEIW